MSDSLPILNGSVGTGGFNAYIDTITVQLLLNIARSRDGQSPIAVDGDVGPETIGAISDFQRKSFGAADGRVDVGGRSFRHLGTIYSEPVLVSPKTYVRGWRGRYKVTVGQDGRIFVRYGDWLSKYSAAIYGDYIHVYDFGRMVGGKLQLLRNIHLIRMGEVLYHIPTWQEYMRGKTSIPIPTPLPLPPQEKKRITDEALKADIPLKGDVGFKVLDGIATFFNYGLPIVDIASVWSEVAGTVGTVGGFISIPLSFYENARDICNSSDLDLRMYGLRAAAYATTAWAFGDPIPTQSPEMRRGLALAKSPQEMRKLDEAWRVAAQAAVDAQIQFATRELGQHPVPHCPMEGAWRCALRSVGDNNRAKLSVELMKGSEERALLNVPVQVRNAAKAAWELGYKTTYPD
jgi:peptidoglycan hydrolase-like protein with peptidoglycan-binding domain